MTPLRPEQKESISTRLAFIEAELVEFEEVRSIDWITYKNKGPARRNIERIIENVANSAIDIGKLIIAGEAKDMPNSYKEVMEQLGLMGIIPMELADELKIIINLRNYLAHQYLDLKWEKIKIFLKNGPETVKKFMSLAQKLTAKNGFPA